MELAEKDLKLGAEAEFAANPGPGIDPESICTTGAYSQHRCRLIADALWQSFTQLDPDRDARAATLARVFQQAGLNPSKPYLEPRAADLLSDPGGQSSYEPLVETIVG